MSASIQSGTFGATIFSTTSSYDPAPDSPDSPDSPKDAGSDIRVGKPMTIEAKACGLGKAESRVRVAPAPTDCRLDGLR